MPPLPCAASKAILALEGVVDHGLFLDMVDVCIIAGSNGVEVRAGLNGCSVAPAGAPCRQLPPHGL